MATPTFYDPKEDIWPELRQETVVLAPVRVGVDRRTGKIIVGWRHVLQSITVIFMTRFHERVLRRWVGSFVPHLLGEIATDRNITRFYWSIAGAIDMWEPNYSITRIRIQSRESTVGTTAIAAPEDSLTSADELREGHLSTKTEGVYRPRGHLGDPTPETRRIIGLIGSGSMWAARSPVR